MFFVARTIVGRVERVKDYSIELERHGIDTFGYTDNKQDNIWVICPFHGDENPSAEVHVTRGTFYCFSCHSTSSFAGYLAKEKGISLEEARRLLAEEERVQNILDNLDEFFFAGVAEQEKVRYIKRAWFEKKFKPIEGTPGERYMKKRKLFIETLQAFNVRWGEWDDETEHVWDDRVIIPVYTDKGKLLTWAGRHIDGGVPKTRKPHSGRATLFGLWNLVKGLQGKRLPYLAPVEGEIDAMWLQQCGVLAVSTMGTSDITDAQMALFYRYAERVVFSYDNDRAGRLATAVGVPKLRKLLPCYSVRLPEGKDPNELTVKEVRGIYSRIF